MQMQTKKEMMLYRWAKILLHIYHEESPHRAGRSATFHHDFHGRLFKARLMKLEN